MTQVSLQGVGGSIPKYRYYLKCLRLLKIDSSVNWIETKGLVSDSFFLRCTHIFVFHQHVELSENIPLSRTLLSPHFASPLL